MKQWLDSMTSPVVLWMAAISAAVVCYGPLQRPLLALAILVANGLLHWRTAAAQRDQMRYRRRGQRGRVHVRGIQGLVEFAIIAGSLGFLVWQVMIEIGAGL